MRARSLSLLSLFVMIVGRSAVAAAAESAPSACRLLNGASMAQLRAAVQAGCTDIVTADGANVTLERAGDGADVTVPAGTRLTFERGSLWTLREGVVIRVLGTYSIPPQRRAFFSGPGRIVADIGTLGMDTCKRAASPVFPEWFGAAANDGQSDSEAIMRAADFGRDIQLDAGTYLLKQPVWLRGGQKLVGAGQTATVLKQTANFDLVRLSDSLANRRPALDIKFNNFAVALDSDCAELSALTVDGSAVTNESLTALTDTPAKRERKEYFHPTYVHAVRVSTDYWIYENWAKQKAAKASLTLARPISNVKVSRVSMRSPATSCIHLQSSVGVRGLLIDSVECDAREALHTTGFNAELFHPDRKFANIYEDVTIQDSRFTGGRYAVLRSAGIKNLRIFRSTFDAKPTTMFTASFYTSDSSGPLAAAIYNSTFRHMKPLNPGSGPAGQQQALGVVEIVARGIQNRKDLPFMTVPEGGTSLKFYHSTFMAPKFTQVQQTIPLVVVRVGTSQPMEFHQSAFVGGTYGILGNRQQTLVLVNEGGINKFVHPTGDELRQHRVESVMKVEKSRFEGQSEAAIVTEAVELHVAGSVFEQIGLNPGKPQPIIQFGQPKTDSVDTDSSFIGNTYSAVHATGFLAATGPSRGTRIRSNKLATGAGASLQVPGVIKSPNAAAWVLDDPK